MPSLSRTARAHDGREVVKLYRRRGSLDPLRRLFVPYRVEREYRLLERHFDGGIACPEPIRWSHCSNARPADFDLLDMLRAIERVAPIDDCARWLEGYGTDAEHVRKLMWMLETHRIERPWLHLHRAETDTRAAWDRLSRPAATRASAAGPRIPRHTRPQ